MANVLTVHDETLSGPVRAASGEQGAGAGAFTLEFPTERITVRELIRERVYQEVQDYNRRRDNGGVYRGLVQPSGAEAMLNGYRLKPDREIDWRQQYDRACEAYESNRVLVLVGDRQTASLDEEIVIARGMGVTFLRLVPLVGG